MIAIFALTAALSAVLLFMVQPLIAKPILPLLGGSPSVWITCMVSFQLLLLLGYCYAYLSGRLLTVRRQSLLHLGLFAVCIVLLPFALRTAAFDAHDHPQFWLLLTLVQSVGGPYLLLSSNAPILQRWIAGTTHKLAKNPYPLYAASNAGSLCGLLGYPIVVEPYFATSGQFGILQAGFMALAAGFVGCAVLTWRYRAPPAAEAMPGRTLPTPRTLRLTWLVYAAIPASLLFGTTTFIITDIASVPLLWILPLTLYIGSFVVAFSEYRWNTRIIGRAYFVVGLPTLLCAVSASLSSRTGITPIIAMVLTLAALFMASFLFHRRLYELRPRAEESGLFYVIMALGGAIGGCFNSFAAPFVFVSAGEFPIVLTLSLLIALLPDFAAAQRLSRQRFPRPAAAVVLAALLLPFAVRAQMPTGFAPFAGWHLIGTSAVLIVVLTAALILGDWLYRSAARAMLALVMVGLLVGALVAGGSSLLYAERNFFGISRVRDDAEHQRRVYSHGVTLHGLQSTAAATRLSPTAYYGPLGDVVASLPASVGGAPIAVVGLGVGTVACYARPQQATDFYEIDPASIHVATDPSLFTFMQDCPGQRRITVGDGRITLNAAPHGRYGLIIIDAFTSDAIPMHLLTLEALRMYGDKLQDHGLIAFNISNRYLDLLPVFRTLCQTLGWTPRYRFDQAPADQLGVSALWMLIARDNIDLALLNRLPAWKPLPPEAGPQYLWTDDYTDLLSVLRFSGHWTAAL